MIITVDGPAASGKSTVARKVAEILGFRYIDTGAMYRALTWQALENGIDISDEEALEKLAKEINIYFSEKNDSVRIFVNGRDVTGGIRLPKVSNNVSIVSKAPGVRQLMVKTQRSFAQGGDLVVEGRDIGTVVFPSAELKVYLTASVSERTRRRKKELDQRGHSIGLDALKREITMRDKVDSNRSVSPLDKAKDAYEVDTTDKSIEQVVGEIIGLYKQRLRSKR